MSPIPRVFGRQRGTVDGQSVGEDIGVAHGTDESSHPAQVFSDYLHRIVIQELGEGPQIGAQPAGCDA